MHIFVDEAGTFAASSKEGSFSLVTGYVIPERHMRLATNVLRTFKMTNGFRHDAEVKRKNVSEQAYFRLLEELGQQVDAVAFAVASDAAYNANARHHQSAQVAKILEGEPSMVHPEGKLMVREMAATIDRLPVQQWIEIACRTRLVWQIIRQASIYYAFRTPATLGAYRWMFDQKDVTKNYFDDTFSSVTLPLTQSLMVHHPFLQIEGGDYSHFRHFYTMEPYPSWLPKVRGPGKLGNLVDARLMWREHLQFVDSKSHPGVQLADLVSSGLFGLLHRRFSDNDRAAQLLGRLMTTPKKGHTVIDLVSLGATSDQTIDQGLANLLHLMKAWSRHLLQRSSERTPR